MNSIQKTHPNPQPNSSHCFACGMENPFGLHLRFYDNGVDEVSCEYSIPEKFQGYPGIAHGGIVAAILDEVVGRTSMIGDPIHFMMTGTMEVKYRLPVPISTPLTILGKRIKARGRVARAQGKVILPDNRVAVEAALMLVDLPPAFQVDASIAQELGWRIYE